MDLSNGHDSLRFNVVLQFKEDYHVTKMSIKVECHEVYILLPNCQTTHTHMETKQTWQTVKKGWIQIVVDGWWLLFLFLLHISEIFHTKKLKEGPARMAELVGASSYTPKVPRLIPYQGTHLGCGFQPWSEHIWEATPTGSIPSQGTRLGCGAGPPLGCVQEAINVSLPLFLPPVPYL